MSEKYIEVNLSSIKKKLILEYASFFAEDEFTNQDLANARKKWIRFTPYAISAIIGELSYHFNRCKIGLNFSS